MKDSNQKPVVRRLNLLGRIVVYIQVGLLMIVSVYLLWALLGGVDAQIILYFDPKLSGEYLKIVNSGETGEQLWMTILNLIAPRMHWFYLSFAASVLVFPILGWMLGRMLDCWPSQAGILPIAGLLSGLNPVRIGGGDFFCSLSLGDQFFVLAVQIICIQTVAVWVYKRKAAREGFGS